MLEEYTNYCTEEQTKRAYKLGAPIETRRYTCPHSWKVTILNDEKMILHIPTTQQMIGWLRDKGIFIFVHHLDDKYEWVIESDNGLDIDNYETYNQAELAAIDTALDYLEKRETK